MRKKKKRPSNFADVEQNIILMFLQNKSDFHPNPELAANLQGVKMPPPLLLIETGMLLSGRNLKIPVEVTIGTDRILCKRRKGRPRQDLQMTEYFHFFLLHPIN